MATVISYRQLKEYGSCDQLSNKYECICYMSSDTWHCPFYINVELTINIQIVSIHISHFLFLYVCLVTLIFSYRWYNLCKSACIIKGRARVTRLSLYFKCSYICGLAGRILKIASLSSLIKPPLWKFFDDDCPMCALPQ